MMVRYEYNKICNKTVKSKDTSVEYRKGNTTQTGLTSHPHTDEAWMVKEVDERKKNSLWSNIYNNTFSLVT